MNPEPAPPIMQRLRLRESPPPTRLERALGYLGAQVIYGWLWLVGRRRSVSVVPFLDGPVGPTGRIGVALYDHLAAVHGLTIGLRDDDGLVPCFESLAGPHFDPARVHPAIRHFYEHTAQYRLDAWSATSLLMAPFLWLLVRTVSRSVDQLNFPVSPLEVSQGMSSHVLGMDDASGRRLYTGWLRRLSADSRVLYAGFYCTAAVPGWDNPCVKVVFPMPRGSATVFLRPQNGPGETFRLVSAGRRFGDPGFYRLQRRGDRLRVRYLRTLREEFDVYVDPQGELRCNHRVSFLGLSVLTLHYRMTLA
jgi:hypothetical protein